MSKNSEITGVKNRELKFEMLKKKKNAHPWIPESFVLTEKFFLFMTIAKNSILL